MFTHIVKICIEHDTTYETHTSHDSYSHPDMLDHDSQHVWDTPTCVTHIVKICIEHDTTYETHIVKTHIEHPHMLLI